MRDNVGRRVVLRDGRRGTVMWPAVFGPRYSQCGYSARHFYDGRFRARLVGYRIKLDEGGHVLAPRDAVEFLKEGVA